MNPVEWLIYAFACAKRAESKEPISPWSPIALVIVCGHELRGWLYRPGILFAPEAAGPLACKKVR